MRIDIITSFPGMFTDVFKWSMVKRAQEKGVVSIGCVDLREFGEGKYRAIDDRPYGGGPGMVLRVDVVDRAVEYAKSMSGATNSRVILLQASGEQLVQKKVYELAALEHLILICGHYEGVDHRVAQKVAHESISIGKYVLSGGEIPAMVVVDAVTRLMPGVLGNEASLVEESFNVEGEKEYPQFTRPKSYRGWVVPEILTGGDHAKIKQWREEA